MTPLQSNQEIGQRIRARRKELHLTLQEVADAVGIRNSTVLRYEQGTIKRLKQPVIESIADALHTTPEYLMGRTEECTEGRRSTMKPLYIEIEQEMLSAAIEAMRDLKAYYEADAAALARLDSPEGRALAQERLESAAVASGLYDYFGSR